ncbi:MAG: hypothetical protein NTV51_12705, partial [Verrucomicrobia bacterium]|nr:hypothetical protein [Verrucomicrobiota bacterium]
FATGNASLLLDRDPGTPAFPTGVDFNEDVPVFELPRSPLLSVAQLQHLSLPAQRPFWVGQSAASAGPAAWNNSLFDQYFFSGLGPGSTWTDLTRPLPNTLARVLRRKPDGTAVAVNDFAAAGTVLSTPPPPADPNDPVLPPVLAAGLSAKYLLQGGAFNLNSTEPDAWAAVLRSVRFPAGREFQYLDADPATGTNADTAVATLSAEAAFPRFSFSAQETYKTTPGYLHTDTGTTNSFTVHTEYYRQGLRTLDAATVTALAQNIAAAVKTRIAAKGPFLSVEEFLQPVVTTVVVPDTSDATGVATITTTTTGPSLLEQAIVDLKLNLDPNDPAGGNLPFSSSFLTQADLLTALAPVLFVRSDTFTIRAYGEATNPVTLLSEGKAWCEAVVQRLPEPFAPATSGQPTDDEYKTPPGSYGRRFKIVSFRWLTKSDI